jgi:hypothetical protein
MQNQHSRHFLFLFLHVRALSLTVVQAVAQAEAEAKAEAEEAAAILKDNSNATDVFISDVKGINPKIIGLYSPTQETGRDGRIVYRKSGECGPEALFIEHDDDEGDYWEVIDRSGPELLLAYVRGGCALEDCCLRKWTVYDGENHVKRPSVKLLTGEEARSKASDRASFASECTSSLPPIVSYL